MTSPAKNRPGPKPKHGEAMSGAIRQRSYMERQRLRGDLATKALGDLHTSLTAIIAALGTGNAVQARAKAELAVERIILVTDEIAGHETVTDNFGRPIGLSATGRSQP